MKCQVFPITFAGDMNKNATKQKEQEIHMHKNASGIENEDKNSQHYFRNNSQRLLPKIQNAFAAILRSYNDRIAQHI